MLIWLCYKSANLKTNIDEFKSQNERGITGKQIWQKAQVNAQRKQRTCWGTQKVLGFSGYSK